MPTYKPVSRHFVFVPQLINVYCQQELNCDIETKQVNAPA